MSATLQPFGLKPIRHINGKFVPPPRVIQGGIASGYNTLINTCDPVKMSNSTGTLNIGASTGSFYGVFAGCQFTPSATGLFTPSMTWPANQTYISDGQMVAMIWDDPNIIYEIQSNGSIAQSAIGNEGNMTNITTGNNGMSVVELSSTLSGTGVQGQLRIVGLSQRIGNAWGDTYTVVEVMIANSQYLNPQTAI